MIDFSDVASAAGYPDQLVEAVRRAVSEILTAGVSVLGLSGDHMVVCGGPTTAQARALLHGLAYDLLSLVGLARAAR